tara:strand:- start:6647 stop:7498 length:852 start_codon:yes stop_codon:yes gene_type:complete
MFIKKHCSPRHKKINYSCLSKNLLIRIANLLNDKYNTDIKTKNKTKKEIYNNVRKSFQKSNCKYESCWPELSIFNQLSKEEQKMIKDSFKPKKPKSWTKKPYTWLTTNDINNVMKQYEKKYPKFKFFGALPIDFDLKDNNNHCLVNQVCNMDLSQFQNKCIGFVFNTDPHNKSGQHWFSIYIDLIGMNRKKPTIYFFDSANPVKNIHELPHQILELIERFQSQNNYELDVFYNDIRHQYGTTECGIYCLHFLIEMLKGTHFLDYIHQRITDKEIKKYRDIFFI